MLNRREIVTAGAAALAISAGGAAVAAEGEGVSPDLSALFEAWRDARWRYDEILDEWEAAELAYFTWSKQKAPVLARVSSTAHIDILPYKRGNWAEAREIVANEWGRFVAGCGKDARLRKAADASRAEAMAELDRTIAEIEADPIVSRYRALDAEQSARCDVVWAVQMAVLRYPARTLADLKAKAVFMRDAIGPVSCDDEADALYEGFMAAFAGQEA